MMLMMSKMLMGMVLFLLYSFKPLLISVMLLGLAFFNFLLYVFLKVYWFSVIFFLIYIGGVLVLFFYMFSLSPNPFTSGGGGVLGGLIFFMSLVFNLFMYKNSVLFGQKFFSVLLLSSSDNWIVVFLTCILLKVLWIMSKVLFKVSGSARVISY